MKNEKKGGKWVGEKGMEVYWGCSCWCNPRIGDCGDCPVPEWEEKQSTKEKEGGKKMSKSKNEKRKGKVSAEEVADWRDLRANLKTETKTKTEEKSGSVATAAAVRYVEEDEPRRLSEKVLLVGHVEVPHGRLTFKLPVLESPTGRFLSSDKLTLEKVVRTAFPKVWQAQKWTASLPLKKQGERRFRVPRLGLLRAYRDPDSGYAEIRLKEQSESFWEILREADI